MSAAKRLSCIWSKSDGYFMVFSKVGNFGRHCRNPTRPQGGTFGNVQFLTSLEGSSRCIQFREGKRKKGEAEDRREFPIFLISIPSEKSSFQFGTIAAKVVQKME